MKEIIPSVKTGMRILVICYMFFALKDASAQNSFIQIHSDAKLDSLIEQNIEINKSDNGIQGYRIQIFFGSERKAAQDAHAKFLQQNPDEEAYLIYQQPNFKVRVGNFRTRLEAQPLFRKVLPEFERVFIVPDKINLPKL